MTFVIRKFDHELRLGAKLKALRKAANITLSEMVIKTKIRKSYLNAFESGNYNQLPDPIYTRNFLKIYVQTLGAEVDYYLDLYEQECGTCDFTDQSRLPRARTQRSRFLVPSKFIKIGVFAVIMLAVVSYIGVQIQTIVSAPNLIVLEPSDGHLTELATVLVTGKAEDGAQVVVNGERVLMLSDGYFEKEVVLERGLNVITIEGSKRYSKSAITRRRVILDQPTILSHLTDVDK